jgi:hypothetical protein
MKFNLETVIFAMGFVLLLCLVASANLWERAAIASSSCTHGCGSDNHNCAGTNVVLSCSGCSYNTSGQTWYDPSTRGSISGSSAVNFVSVNCNKVIPCDTVATYTGRRCTGTGACIAAIFTPSWSECSHYAAGTEHVNTVSTCITATCEE